MIRTYTIPCHLPRAVADALNAASGAIYTGVLVAHWRVVRKKDRWLSETAGTRWSDARARAPLHAHSIDAAHYHSVKDFAWIGKLREISEARHTKTPDFARYSSNRTNE
jgi:hypothetical protein